MEGCKIWIQELIDTIPEEFTEDNWMEMNASQLVLNSEEEDLEAPESKLTLNDMVERYSLFKRLLLTSFMTWTLLRYLH